MIMALDQSSNITGFACLDKNKKLLDYGAIDVSKMPKGNAELATEKRWKLKQGALSIIKNNDIKQVVCEGVYGSFGVMNNTKGLITLSQVKATIEDMCRDKEICCYTFENASAWRKLLELDVGNKNREIVKDITKAYVLGQFNIENEIKDKIFNKYKLKKHTCFDDMSKVVKNIQFDIYDAIAMALAYFKLFED